MGPRVIVRICRQMAKWKLGGERLYDDLGHHMSLRKVTEGRVIDESNFRKRDV